MEPIHITDKNDLIKQIHDNSDKLLIFMFTASWCGPCKAIKRAIYNDKKEGLANDKRCVYFYIDVEENEELSSEFKIDSMPTFMIHKVENGKLVLKETFKGANKDKLVKCVEDYS